MKKILAIVVLCMCTAVVFAGPHHGWHHGGRHHRHHHGSDGVWMAAGITGIVANGIQILNGITYPVRTTVVTPAPVYQQPVVVPQPVYQQPVYVQPQPIVVPQPAPAVYYPPQPIYTQPVYRYPAPAPRPMYYRNVYIEKGYAPVLY